MKKFLSLIKSGFGSNPEFYRKNIVPSLIAFLLLLIVDSYIQFTQPSIPIRLASKIVFISWVSWLLFLNYIMGNMPLMIIWLSNIVLSAVIIMSFFLTSNIFIAIFACIALAAVIVSAICLYKLFPKPK